MCHITWRAATNAADKWAYHRPQFCGRTPPSTAPLSETGGSRCKTRCPSAAVVKRALSQYSGEQCVTRIEGGPACVETPGGPTMGWRLAFVGGGGGGYSPRLPQLCPVLPAFGNHPQLWCERKWTLFNSEEVISDIPQAPPPHNISHSAFTGSFVALQPFCLRRIKCCRALALRRPWDRLWGCAGGCQHVALDHTVTEPRCCKNRLYKSYTINPLHCSDDVSWLVVGVFTFMLKGSARVKTEVWCTEVKVLLANTGKYVQKGKIHREIWPSI